MVGQVSEIRRAERQGRGGGPVSLPGVIGPDARHDGRRCLPGLPEEKRGEPRASGKWIREEGRGGFEAHLIFGGSVVGKLTGLQAEGLVTSTTTKRGLVANKFAPTAGAA